MLCGILLGPILGWVSPAQFGAAGSALATMALVVILFEGGVDLDLSSLMCFIVYGVTELLGFSGAIAALCFGLLLANGRRFAEATGLIRPGRLAAAVLAGLPLQQGVVGGEIIRGVAFVVVPLSIGLTAVMIRIQRSAFATGVYRKLFRSQQT